jgi:hypothetical protein
VTPAERTAGRLYATGQQPTDIHDYATHVAYDLLSGSGDITDDRHEEIRLDD